MAYCNAKCTETCLVARCYCNLPLFVMDHVQLPCCNEAVHHVLCICEKSICPDCRKLFSGQTKKYIKNLKNRILLDLQKKENREQKQRIFRKHIEKEVKKIIVSMIKETKRETKYKLNE